MRKKESFFQWILKVFNVVESTNKEILEVKEIVTRELELKENEIESRVTEKIMKKLLKKNREDLEEKLIDEEQINRAIEKQLKTLRESLNSDINNDFKKKVSLLKEEELKNQTRSSGQVEEESRKIQNQLNKLIMEIDKITKGSVKELKTIFKDELNEAKNNINKEISNRFQENIKLKEQLEEQKNDYTKLLEVKQKETKVKLNDLEKYEDGLKKVRNLLKSLESNSLRDIKKQIYIRYSLIEGEENIISNTVKLALESKINITKVSLKELRRIKIENKREIDNEEIEFYKSINNFYGIEVVLVDRLNDSKVDRKYWEIGGSYTKIEKKIFPPMNMGEIILGVAQGAY
jgi:hypothetical protein